MKNDFEQFLLTSLKLMEDSSIDYMIIGGIAAGIWGKPRFTQDIDVAIKLEKEKIPNLLKKAQIYGFRFEKEVEKKLKSTGIARLKFGFKSLDIISALVGFEKNALKRKKEIKLFNHEAYIASPEDLILYKLISSRNIDMADIENIVDAQNKKLDKKYLKKWGYILSSQLDLPFIKEKLKEIL